MNLLNDKELEILKQLINESSNIVICCHTNPDGDAIGSSLAWANIMGVLGKEATVIVPDMFPDFLQWLPGTDRIVRFDKHQQRAELTIAIADLIFCLDFNDFSRTDSMAEVLVNAKAKKVMIDHHLSPAGGFELTVSHPELGSTAELVFRLTWQLGLFEKADKTFAVQTYCGMMTDTGGFTYNSNSSETFMIISHLLTKGIDKDKIYRNVYHNFSEWRLRLMGFVMSQRLVVVQKCHAAFYYINRADMKRFHFMKGDAEGLVNMPLQIKGLKLSISLREDSEINNKIHCSIRSVDNFPANEIAEKFFNGGGHLNAAGGRLNCSLPEAIETTKRAIEYFGHKFYHI